MQIHELQNSTSVFASDDFVMVSGQTNNTRKMSKDAVLEQTATNTLKNNVAPEFDSTIAYTKGQFVTYQGKIYQFTSDHSAGAWNASHATVSGQNALLKMTAQNALAGNIAPTFSTATAYAVGDLVTYQGQLYRCKAAHSAGAWADAHFQATTFKDEVARNTELADVVNAITSQFNPSTACVVGKLYWYEGDLYKCNTAYTGAWDSTKFDTTTIDAELRSIENVIENNKKILEISIADTVCGQNLINKDKLGPLGEWCNYITGKIESTQSVTTYHHSNYIKVDPSTSYARRNSNDVAAAGAVFFDKNFNFISGTHGSRFFTSPVNAAYIIVNINTTYETADNAVLIKGSSPLAVDAPTPAYYNDFKYPNPTYVSKDYLKENLPEFVTSQNLLNKDKLGPLGEWCNYITGQFQSTQYVTTYRHSDFIPVKPNTSYARRSNSQTYNAGYATFDANKTFISGGQAAVITTPANCKYIVINIDTTYESEARALLIESETSYSSTGPNLPYYNDFKYPNPNISKEYVTVGATNSDFTSVGDAFEYALLNDKYVVIKPGIYDLVAEGISGSGYTLPKKVIGYGAKLVCNLSEEDWDLSPLYAKPDSGTSVEVYGLEIECSNCRYCIHDEMGSNTNRSPYHHVFKDLILIHNSPASSVLIAPDNIGGGFGDGGYIEIINCKMTAAYSRNFAYHSNGYNQQKDCIIQCHGCYFNKRIQLSPAGTPAEGVKSTLYVSDCVFGTNKPVSGTTSSGTLVTKAWNNILESELQ